MTGAYAGLGVGGLGPIGAGKLMKAGERGTYGPWQIQKHASARFRSFG